MPTVPMSRALERLPGLSARVRTLRARIRMLRARIGRAGLYRPLMRRLYRLFLLLPARPDLVVFESGMGTQYADSPRYIFEQLQRTRPDLRAVWIHDEPLPVAGRTVKRLSPRYFWYLARARYWVNNQSFPHYLTRRPDGVYLQTWHGTPVKRMARDLATVHGRREGYVQRAVTAAAQWSVLVSPNRHTTEVMRSAFDYRGTALEVGYPRNDVLHADDRPARARAVRDRLGLPDGQRVVLYAPTFRDQHAEAPGRFVFRLPFDLDRLHQALGPDTVLLLRTHVLISNQTPIPPRLARYVRDVSDYPEVQDLLLIADALITDYSSVLFDYAELGRPMLFYAYDLAEYGRTVRGFYLDYESELPGPVLQSEPELLEAVARLDAIGTEYADRLTSFTARFGSHDDGHAAERVVQAVFGPAR